MAANIKTTLNGDSATDVLGSSRDDLSAGDVVRCTSADAALTEAGYQWTLAHTPTDLEGEESSAELTVDGNYCEFTVDKEGPYLVRLVVDPGTEHEDEQYLRLRALTQFGSLRLIAAGEQMGDETIPSDLTGRGWAEDQNYNLKELLSRVSHLTPSGRVLYVDANRGMDYTNPPNETVGGHGHFSTIQEAIDYTRFQVPEDLAASMSINWDIVIQPGVYEETLEVYQGVRLIGNGPSTKRYSSVVVRSDQQHHFYGGGATNINFINHSDNEESVIRSEPHDDTLFGWVEFTDCQITKASNGANQGAALRATGVMEVRLVNCGVLGNGNALPSSSVGISIEDGAGVQTFNTDVRGSEAVHLLGGGSKLDAVSSSFVASSQTSPEEVYAIRVVGELTGKSCQLQLTKCRATINLPYVEGKSVGVLTSQALFFAKESDLPRGYECDATISLVYNTLVGRSLQLQSASLEKSLTFEKSEPPTTVGDDPVLWANEDDPSRIGVAVGENAEKLAYLSEVEAAQTQAGAADSKAESAISLAVSVQTAAMEAFADLQAQIDGMGGHSGSQKTLERVVVEDLDYVCHDCDVYVAVKTQAGLDTVIHLEADPLVGRRLYVVDETGLGRVLVRPESATSMPSTINGVASDLILTNRAAVHLVCGGQNDSGVVEWFLS